MIQQLIYLYYPITLILVCLFYVRTIKLNKDFLIKKELKFRNLFTSRYTISYAISVFSIIALSALSFVNFLEYFSIIAVTTDSEMELGYLLVFLVFYGLIQYLLVNTVLEKGKKGVEI